MSERVKCSDFMLCGLVDVYNVFCIYVLRVVLKEEYRWFVWMNVILIVKWWCVIFVRYNEVVFDFKLLKNVK